MTLGASIIAVLGTLGGTMLKSWLDNRERGKREAAELARRGRELVAPVKMLLSDAEPMRLGINAGPTSQARVSKLDQRWQNLRGPLAVYSASHPALEVGAAVDALVISTGNALHTSFLHLKDLLDHSASGPEMLDQARKDHAAANEAADTLLELLRQTRP